MKSLSMMPELNKIYQGDSLEIMKSWPDSFVHCAVTSPPYWGLRDYGMAGQIGLEKTPEEYVNKMVTVFREVRRVLRNDGTLWLNIGDSYASGGRFNHGNKVGYKQTTNLGSSGQFDPIRRDNPEWLKTKDVVGIPWMLAFALRSEGWYLRADIIWSKPNPMPESVMDRPTKAHEYVFLLSKKQHYYYDYEAIREPATLADAIKMPDGWDSGKGAHGSFHKNGREKGQYKNIPEGQSNIRELRDKQRGHSRRHDGFNDRWDHMEREEQCSGMRNKLSVWTVSPQPFPEAHFATFPEKLIEPCILAGSMWGGVVLDPFMGAGTTALVASRLNRKFIGCEINPEYIKIAQNRIAPEVMQDKMF